MHPVAAPNAGLRANSPVAGEEIPMAAVVDIEIVKPARCIPPPAPVVAMRPRCHFNHAMTGPSIAAIATNRNEQAVPTTDGHAGNLYDRDSCEAGRFV